jgi:uncharacterized DUF497 family protein
MTSASTGIPPRRANLRNHGVSFEEAQAAFADEFALLVDAVHSEDEDRFILLGLSARLRLLVVVHCYRTAPDSHAAHLR